MVSDLAVGVVLAAGAGTRYGSPKVLAHDGLWLRTAVQALRDGGCDRVVVVLGAADAPVPDGVIAVYAPQWEQGMSASFEAGLTAASDADYAVVHVVDTPDVGPEVVQAVLAAARETGLARAVFDGRPGHPVVLARRHVDAAVASASGDFGARDFLRGRDDVIAVECSQWATGIDHDYR
ncbi:nucleotidyltransferase family protein [Rhodococcus sp. IEGM 1401]|uniref:Nucleotidyltransferase family protein n=1 Tax=Rhodococcus cerastii TaxID=908616 RepID=A0ABU4CVV6_9NOCA|nr:MULTISPECIES: nucleotidyltransferase family protein [Rhodococcus]MCZ4559280.1 nucleotidyltransferase family protein [Rhodococcus sp. IEGM 1401]MDI9919767.1 nucleotidyltransferase family protein [Rhodococcus sp. IEGM 1372]MDV6301286.1 nucleotidyltransferase family protein [Rhodococcus cerastii]MDV7987747.1 nucleotidyltransferase family protein [Rhodococcus sp. IEGM 1374]MDV8031859.1 nucleotidyltransferase family protein [Rhodococcus sp. IEGM 1414]